MLGLHSLNKYFMFNNKLIKEYFEIFKKANSIHSFRHCSQEVRRMAEGKEIGVNNQSLSNMKKIYVRHEPLQDKVQITFHYQDQELSVNREFNFCRKLSECIDVALSRIRTNVSNELTKDSKKKIKKSKKKKTPENVVDQEAAAAKVNQKMEKRKKEKFLIFCLFFLDTCGISSRRRDIDEYHLCRADFRS